MRVLLAICGQEGSGHGRFRALCARAGLVAVLAVPAAAPAATKPAPDRYDFANGCYAMHSLALDRYIAKADGGYAASARARPPRPSPSSWSRPSSAATSSTDPAKDFFAANGDGIEVATDAEPSDRAEWEVDESGDGFSITSISAAKPLAANADGTLASAAAPKRGVRVRDGRRAAPTTRRSTSARSASPAGGETPVRRGLGPRRRPHAHDGLRVPRRRGRTAASPGTATARRTRSSTAPTTAGTAAARCSRTRSPAARRTDARHRSAGRPSRTGRRTTR